MAKKTSATTSRPKVLQLRPEDPKYADIDWQINAIHANIYLRVLHIIKNLTLCDK